MSTYIPIPNGRLQEHSSLFMYMNYSHHHFHCDEYQNSIGDSKYLKPAQQLLDEVVNVKKASSHRKQGSMHDSNGNTCEQDPSLLSAAEKQGLRNKITKLSSMLNEVDRRYKQYYQQMQMAESSFDAVAGCGAAKSYTALALHTISTQFRCLRDAINTHIKATETDSNGNGIAISRLRFVDQQLRQQRRVQQYGLMHQHIWRPQRGLPETSVSILRAWLFEHFLHPYPKDSEKMMLARKTGLSRSQVSNWFINARVRLWKPMVEEMYKEESVAMDSNSSSEVAPKKASPDQADQSGASSHQVHDTKMADTCLYTDFHPVGNAINQSNNEGVSLTLRLQHSENSNMSVGSHHYSLTDLRVGKGGVHEAIDFSGFT